MLRISITAIFFLSCFAAAAQPTTMVNYGVDDGLPQSSIYDITQDRNGFLWIGTADGLSRFDGYQFYNYKTSQKNPRSISGYKEYRFYTDRQGRMWIVSFSGISLYNDATNDFTNVLVYHPKNVVIAENHFFGEDEKFLYVGLCSYGIVKVDKQTLQVINTPLTRTGSRPSNSVGYHGFLDRGKIWMIDDNDTQEKVFSTWNIATGCRDTIRLPLTNILNMNDSEALGITVSAAVLISKKNLSCQYIRFQPEKEHNVVSMYRLSDHEAVLCSTTKGLFYIDTRQRKLARRIEHADNSRAVLDARCVYVDRSGNTWIGSRGKGVYRINYPYKNFHSYQAPNSTNNVFGVYADDVNLYAGITSEGLTRFSRKTGVVNNTELSHNVPGALNNAYTISPFGNDRLMIMATSSENNGHSIPFLYHKTTGAIKVLDKAVQDFFSQNWGRGNLRHFIFRDAAQRFITSAGENLVAIRQCGTSFCASVIHRFAGETLTCGFADRDGHLWAGTFTGVFIGTGNDFTRVPLPVNKEVKAICQDIDGNIWLGTNDELYVLDPERKLTAHYTEENGLKNGHIYGILCDRYGNIWFSHNKGISVYRRDVHSFQHFGREDGLISTEYNIGAYFKAPDGELFFGGINGVTAFYPQQILQNRNAPPVLITGIRLFDEPYRSDTAYWNLRHITLPYTENSLSFDFALPELSDPARNRYEYMMEGVDNKWTSPSDRRFARYAGLQPGHYRFKVRGANSDGVYSAGTASIVIDIIPPFWKRDWFLVLAILCLVMLSAGIGFVIQRRKQRKTIRAMEMQHRIQLERERISRDLHDNVGTQLSLISRNIDGMINPSKGTDSEAQRLHRLGNISRTSKEVIFTLRETIWALNREAISFEELSDKLKSFALKLFELSNCRLLFNEEIKQDISLSSSEAIHLFRICQEAITNSLKYANATEMTIALLAQDNRFRITIADNGVGFDKRSVDDTGHYGLGNMAFRAAEIGCTCTVESSEGAGTRVVIQRK